jgi:hypothetical protein
MVEMVKITAGFIDDKIEIFLRPVKKWSLIRSN